VTEAKLIADLLALSPKRRAKIAGILIRSLDEEEDVDQEAVDAAWAKELVRRVEEIRAGKVKLVSGDAFMKNVRAKIKRARQRTR
jgi:putative addiction module component (TIGR02574 family)